MVKSRPLDFHRSVRILPHDHMKRASRDLVHPIVNRCFRFSYGSSNLGHYNSSDTWLGLIRLIK